MKCSTNQDCMDDFKKSMSYVAGNLEWLLPNFVSVIARVDGSELNRFRKCRHVVKECSKNWTDVITRQLCYNNSSLYVGNNDNIVYKNIHCALCNHEDIDKLSCLQLSSTVDGRFADIWPPELKDKFQFNWIMDFSLESSQKCADIEEVYDEFVEKCMTLTCADNYEMVDGKCLLESELHQNISNFTMYSCTRVRVPIDELSVFPNGSVYWDRTQTLYSVVEIELFGNNSYLLCVEADELGSNTFGVRHFSATQSLLSLICTSISLVCLAVHIVIQCLTGQHRKLPGKCLLNLSLALFLGHFLLVFGINRTEIKDVCFAIAVLIHYFFLAVFFWMNIMAIDIFRTFSRSFQRSSWKSKTFLRYCIYSWFNPSIIVAAAISTDFLNPTSNIRPFYGHGVCWIANRHALFIFLALPLAIILICNVILFLITAYKIHETVTMNDSLQKSTERKRFRVYVKLAFVVGIPWIIGFAAAFTDFEPLWYAFAVLNASQGTLIFVIFTLKRSVFVILRKKITGKSSPITSNTKRTENVSLTQN